jgi:hypothetical protein
VVLREGEAGRRRSRREERAERERLFVRFLGRATNDGDRDSLNNEPERDEDRNERTGERRQDRREHHDGDANDGRELAYSRRTRHSRFEYRPFNWSLQLHIA